MRDWKSRRPSNPGPAQNTQGNFLTKCSSCLASIAAGVHGQKVDAGCKNEATVSTKASLPAGIPPMQSWPLNRTPGIIDNITPFLFSHIFETIWNERYRQLHD